MAGYRRVYILTTNCSRWVVVLCSSDGLTQDDIYSSILGCTTGGSRSKVSGGIGISRQLRPSHKAMLGSESDFNGLLCCIYIPLSEVSS